MKVFALLAGALVAMLADPLSAETLTIDSYRPAESEAAADVHAIAVGRIGGADGARFGLRLADQLRGVQLAGRDWFSVYVSARAAEADAVLEGVAEPSFTEYRFKQKREVCQARDADGDCTEEREVELDCLRVVVALRPELRLVAYDGELLWAGAPERSEQFSYCPRHDPVPNADPVVDRLIEGLVPEVRVMLAPSFNGGGVRILESRRGLSRALHNDFREAVALTKTDEGAACAAFARLHAANPDHDSLMFNIGLCAERAHDFDAAIAYYERALASDRSDDEASAGIERIAATRRAEQQIARHFGA